LALDAVSVGPSTPSLRGQANDSLALAKRRSNPGKLLKTFVCIGSQGECEAFVRTPLTMVRQREINDN